MILTVSAKTGVVNATVAPQTKALSSRMLSPFAGLYRGLSRRGPRVKWARQVAAAASGRPHTLGQFWHLAAGRMQDSTAPALDFACRGLRMPPGGAGVL